MKRVGIRIAKNMVYVLIDLKKWGMSKTISFDLYTNICYLAYI